MDRQALSRILDRTKSSSAGAPTYAVLTLGCKLNQYDSAVVAAGLGGEDSEAPSYREADIVVVNSCTVTHKADRGARKLARRVRRVNPKALVAVMGCSAKRIPADYAAMPEVDVVLAGPEDLGVFLDVCSKRWPRRSELSPIPHFKDLTRAFMKVQEGCNLRCAYCIIPSVRGPSVSVPRGVVLAEFQAFLGKGFKEVVFTGVNTGDYGLDLASRCRLEDLMEDLLSVSGDFRIRLNSLEPRTIRPRLVELFRAEPARLARHLHIPLQSGSDEVLEAMRRNYRTDLYREVVERLVAEVPGIGVGADLLTGFPSETERHHEETMAFLESLPIAFVHAFSYSTREGTEAASMKPLSGEIVSRRNEELRELGERKSKAFIEGQCGAPLRALTLGATRDNLACAMTGNYIQVVLPGEPVVPNCWVTVTPDRHESDNAAVGRIVSDCEPRY